MSSTRITLLPDNKIEGWADTLEVVNNFRMEPDSLYWKRMPPLTGDFNPELILGTITKLEYREGQLWCEATLKGPIIPANYRFGVKFTLERYTWEVTDGKDDLIVVSRAELLEIGIVVEKETV